MTVTTTTEVERLRRDVFPAEVVARGYAREHPVISRVFVTDRRVIVWGRDAQGEPVVLIDDPITGEVPQRTRESLFGELVIETPTGTLFVTRGEGCGCRSPLKRIDPPVTW